MRLPLGELLQHMNKVDRREEVTPGKIGDKFDFVVRFPSFRAGRPRAWW